MAGTVAIVAALAVTTLVLLTGDDATSALAAKVATAVAPVVAAPAAAAVAASKVAAVATAPKVAMAAAPKAPIVAKAAAPRKVAVAGKGTSKMSDNWKVNEDVPDSPTYSDLEREVQELQKAEKKHFNTRAASLTNAMTSATKDGNKPGLKGLKWKNSKDKYEQAAYKDIMDEEKERIKDSITEEGAEMFQHYEKKAQSLMGTDDLKKLQNSTEIAEKMRSMREKSALIALKSANAALKKVEVAQDEAREQEDRKKQMRANAKMAAHLQSAVAAESGSKQYYKKVAAAKVFDTERMATQKELVNSYRNDHEALQARDSSALHPKHADTPYHKDYLEARSIEDKRNAAFAKEIQQLKNKVQSNRQVRAKLLRADEAVDAKEALSHNAQSKEAVAAALKESGAESKHDDAAFEKGSAAEAEAVKAVVANKALSVSDDYQATVQKAMEADLMRRTAEGKARLAFRSERAKKLAADSSNTGKLEASMTKVSEAIMQPNQLVNAARVNQGEGDTGMAARIIAARNSEVNLIMGGK